MFRDSKIKEKIEEIANSILNLTEVVSEEKLIKQIAESDQIMHEPNFWDNAIAATEISRKNSHLKESLKTFRSFKERSELLIELFKIIETSDYFDDDYEDCVNKFAKSLNQYKIKTLLNGEYDFNNAIVTIKAGAGGTESMDWVNMLFRMYSGYANKNNFKISLLGFEEGNETGYKSLEFLVKGDFAYGMLKNESGVHRLVRISPFDANSRRHTSFASVEVSPEVNEDIEINIDKNDLRIDTYRSSGAGGQHVNKTDSAIRITHLPTGIVVSCQNERSAIQNRQQAFKMLNSKLLNLKLKEKQKIIDEKNSKLKKIDFGSQIRSYIFCPYTLVKDHRTNFETSNILSVMDGEIESFINEMIKLQNL